MRLLPCKSASWLPHNDGQGPRTDLPLAEAFHSVAAPRCIAGEDCTHDRAGNHSGRHAGAGFDDAFVHVRGYLIPSESSSNSIGQWSGLSPPVHPSDSFLPPGCLDVSSGRFDNFARRRHCADPGGYRARGSHFVGGHDARTSCMARVGNGGSSRPLCSACSFGASTVEKSPSKREFALWPMCELI